jgi:hypothetical protein
VLTWFTFVDLVRSNVNPLAGEEHMKELMHQLKLMGEVCIFLRSFVCENSVWSLSSNTLTLTYVLMSTLNKQRSYTLKAEVTH